ncbi:hypothetical protein KC349_g298 [Hortaea werneckii]|nr:hypothetical protein KC349_g298 [Hortaea werneckii]
MLPWGKRGPLLMSGITTGMWKMFEGVAETACLCLLPKLYELLQRHHNEAMIFVPVNLSGSRSRHHIAIKGRSRYVVLLYTISAVVDNLDLRVGSRVGFTLRFF